jgi:hypothetical protein
MASGPSGLAHLQASPSDPTTSFQNYFNSNKEKGTVGGAVGDNNVDDYLPEDAQLRYFTEDRIQHIHAQLYPHLRHSDVVPMYDAGQVRRKYRKIFATLLYIGRGALLDSFLSHISLDDKHLPFMQKPLDFPGSDDDYTFFSEAQWKFHVLPMKYWLNIEWHPRQILPFKSIGRLSEGNDGKAHQVVIHPSHNKLDARDLSSNSGPNASASAAEPNQVSTHQTRCYTQGLISSLDGGKQSTHLRRQSLPSQGSVEKPVAGRS